MTQTVDQLLADLFPGDPASRVAGFIAEHSSDSDAVVHNLGGALYVSDLQALVAAARATAELEEENARLRALTGSKVRTGQLLAQARRDRDRMRDTLVEVEELAARHHRGDPYGVQGAAAQQILDVLAAGPTAGMRTEIAATALEAAADELVGHATGFQDSQALAAGWLLQRAAEVRTGSVRG